MISPGEERGNAAYRLTGYMLQRVSEVLTFLLPAPDSRKRKQNYPLETRKKPCEVLFPCLRYVRLTRKLDARLPEYNDLIRRVVACVLEVRTSMERLVVHLLPRPQRPNTQAFLPPVARHIGRSPYRFVPEIPNVAYVGIRSARKADFVPVHLRPGANIGTQRQRRQRRRLPDLAVVEHMQRSSQRLRRRLSQRNSGTKRRLLPDLAVVKHMQCSWKRLPSYAEGSTAEMVWAERTQIEREVEAEVQASYEELSQLEEFTEWICSKKVAQDQLRVWARSVNGLVTSVLKSACEDSMSDE